MEWLVDTFHTHLVVETDTRLLRHLRGPLHDFDSFVVVPAKDRGQVSAENAQSRKRNGNGDSLVSHFHLGPFTPHLGEFVDFLERNENSLRKDFSSAREVRLSISSHPSRLVEFRKVNPKRMEVGGGLFRHDRFRRIGVRLCDLDFGDEGAKRSIRGFFGKEK